MENFGCIKEVVVGLLLCGIAIPVSGRSWTGPPYNIALIEGQTGTISCNGSLSLYWRSLSPTIEGLGNDNADARPGYNVSEFPPGIHHLQFNGSASSTPTIISCSEPRSGIEKRVNVIVFETPSCKASPTGDATNVTCSANFRSERQYRPHFECGPINGSQEIVGSNDVGDAQTITGTFSFARNASNMTIMCSVKFSKSDADLDGTAVNTPELPWQWIHVVPGQGIDDSKKHRSGDIGLPPWGIALIVMGITAFAVGLVLVIWKVLCSRRHDHLKVPQDEKKLTL